MMHGPSLEHLLLGSAEPGLQLLRAWVKNNSSSTASELGPDKINIRTAIPEGHSHPSEPRQSKAAPMTREQTPNVAVTAAGAGSQGWLFFHYPQS